MISSESKKFETQIYFQTWINFDCEFPSIIAKLQTVKFRCLALKSQRNIFDYCKLQKSHKVA